MAGNRPRWRPQLARGVRIWEGASGRGARGEVPPPSYKPSVQPARPSTPLGLFAPLCSHFASVVTAIPGAGSRPPGFPFSHPNGSGEGYFSTSLTAKFRG